MAPPPAAMQPEPSRPQPTVRHPEQLGLARRAHAGSPVARRELAQALRCVPRILAALNQRNGSVFSPEDLEDAAQDVATAMWRRLDSYSGQSSLESWAFGFCQNVLSERMRSHRRRPHHVEHSEERVPQVARANEPQMRDDLAALHRALANMSDADSAELVRLHHFDGLTFPELGTRLGITANAAKKRYHRALERLRIALASVAPEGTP